MSAQSFFARRVFSARRWSIAAVAAGAAAGCGTKDAASPLSPGGATGRVRFVNLITDTTLGRVNAILERVPFGVNLTYAQSTPATLPAPATALYSPILTGGRTLVLKRTIDTSVTVATIGFTVNEGQDRTIFALGGAGGSAVTSVVTADTNPVTTSSQTRLRVVQMSPTAGAVDVFVTAPGADLATATPVATNLSYQSASAYFTVAPGTYRIRAVPAGTAPASRAANVRVNVTDLAFAGGTDRTIVIADAGAGGTPLQAFVLADR
jgi:hypothetical protein